MSYRKSLLTVCGVILGLAVAVSASAWVNSAARTTYLTFSGPVGLPGVTLGTGTYLFELAAPNSNLDIVRVMNKERNLVIYTGFTEQVERPAGLPASAQISFAEAPKGVAPPISVWYPQGERVGHRFLYKNR